MTRIHDYDAPGRDMLRRQLNQYLSKALAYRRTGKVEKSHEWAGRLVDAMVKARLLSRAGVGEYGDELTRSLREGR